MAADTDKNLKTLESELQFLRRHLQTIETEDFTTVDECGMSVENALRVLFEYNLSLQPACEEVPTGGRTSSGGLNAMDPGERLGGVCQQSEHGHSPTVSSNIKQWADKCR